MKPVIKDIGKAIADYHAGRLKNKEVKSSDPASHMASEDQMQANDNDDPHGIEKLKEDMCPGCHAKVRQHFIDKAAMKDV